MTELISLLDTISKDIDFHGAIADIDEDTIRPKADEYFRRFIEVYSTLERHKYSDIARYVHSQTPDIVDSLRDGIKCIIECAEMNCYNEDEEYSENKKCYLKICKLFDHIELEAARYQTIKKIELIAQENAEHEQATMELITRAEKNVTEAKRHAKNLSQQLISILGIFAGIIVTFSFATTVIGETVATMPKSEVTYIGFVISLLGVVFLNLIAFLLTFVTKLSGHEFKKTFPWLIYTISNLVIIALTVFLFFQIK